MAQKTLDSDPEVTEYCRRCGEGYAEEEAANLFGERVCPDCFKAELGGENV